MVSSHQTQGLIWFVNTGLFDLSESAEYISKEIIKCLTLAEEGLHAVVLVLSARTRITQEEENTLITLQALFGSEILDYLIVLFTGGDVLEERNQTLDNYFRQGCPEFLEVGDFIMVDCLQWSFLPIYYIYV